ncbi:chemotaxis protein CheW [Photobacterium frigidiphilum]|uniref:Chemotaxis protein CheW n=1 Tax=Photobacterium frigidiphilum TaxID=264736 RepID=A0A2T3JF45_9GAMM|nr:chemotaxis protein CheW [Photobacterium frigidiphilum]PSU47524.1 chemotaxis protein CheW [Photobacterium frigidiphilum]
MTQNLNLKKSRTREDKEEVVALEQQQFLTFLLREELFAINIRPIKEIIEYGQLTKVPMVPEFVRGVINVRGNVVPIIDLSMRFGWPTTLVTKRSCIVIVEVESEGESLEIGVLVDAVSEVIDISLTDIEPAPSFGAKLRTDFIQGMGKVNDEFIVLLNVSHVLSVDELSSLESL